MPRALALLLLVTACQGSRREDWARVSQGHAPANAVKLPALVPDSRLKAFLPERVAGRQGALPQGTMTRMGDRALSEVTRSYRDGEIELKIADAWLEPRAAQAIRTLADTTAVGQPFEARSGEPGRGALSLPGRSDDPGSEFLAERLVLPGAVGYARYDEEARLAQAQVLIAGRFIASATVADAEDAQDAAQALRALDTLGLARLAQAQ